MKAHVLVVDNYDSFTYNLVQALRVIGARVTVRRNDVVSLDEIQRADLTHLVVSPGPGRPEQAGQSAEVVRSCMTRLPILGVCLGHQTLAIVGDADVGSAQQLMHGKASPVYHDSKTLFEGLPNPFMAGRYHSLAVAEPSLSAEWAVSAYTSDGEVMGIRHRRLPTEGVQFHPESVLTPDGDRLLRNFLDLSLVEAA